MSTRGLRIAVDGRPALWGNSAVGTIAHLVMENIQSAGPANQYFAYFDRDPGGAGRSYSSVVCSHGGSQRGFLWANSWLPQRLHRDRIDAYITFLDRDVPIVPTRARVISMVNDLVPILFPDAFPSALHRVRHKCQLRAAAFRSDLVLTNSACSRDEIVSALKLDERKVQAIRFGAEPAASVSSAKIASVLHRNRLEAPFVLAVGSTEPHRNNARVLQAMQLISRSHPGLKIAVAGCAWRNVEFEPGLVTDRVQLLGHVPEPDLAALMAAAEMLVLPSLHDGLGLEILDAMALGVPVITSPVTALAEIAGDAALYADPHSPAEIAARMQQILSDPELVALLRAKGKERAEGFRWSETCAAIGGLCEGLMEKREWRTQPAT